MKNFTLAFLLVFLSGAAMAQQVNNVANTSRIKHKDTYQPKLDMILKGQDEPEMLSSVPVAPLNAPSAKAAGTQAVSPVALGRASNAFTYLRGEQNQMWASNALNLVTMIHRQDVTIWGGGGTANGKFRYDLSTDGGASFTNDIGALQTFYINYGRYPNISGYNPAGNSNPFAAFLPYTSPTNRFPIAGWLGHVYGLSDVTTGAPTSTEQYLFDSDPTLLPGGLCEGLPGEFWSVEFQYDGTNITNNVSVYKSVYNAINVDLDVTRHVDIGMNANLAFDGTANNSVGPNIAFSPDGMNGWIGYLGDVTGGSDSVLSPVFIKSTDGGATWGTPVEVDLRTIAWVKDSLQSFWIDSLGGPAGDGRPTCGFDYDLTVDANGNPHMAVLIGHGSTPGNAPGYSIYSGLEKIMADVYSTDGGSTWDVHFIGYIFTMRGEFGTPDPGDGSLLTMDNFCQVSRSESGQRIYYSWLDSDTSVIGFGESANLAPNLRIAGFRITDGFATCVKWVTDGDILWDGNILYANMAPTVLDKPNGYTVLPIAFMNMLVNDQAASCQSHYLGNDSYFHETEFVDQAVAGVQNPCFPVAKDVAVSASSNDYIRAYPNPAQDQANFKVNLGERGDIEITLVSMLGQKVAEIAKGNYAAGTYDFTVNTNELAPGIYLYSLKTANRVLSEKLTVVK